MTNQYVFILLLFLLPTACQEQEQEQAQAIESTTSELGLFPDAQVATQDTSPQIAEYIVEMTEDKKGNLWFGTMAKGAARYDGKTLRYFTTTDGLCGNTVASIAEDHAGNIWFGTHSGASKYDGKTFTNFGIKEGLSGAGCNILVDSRGTIWAGTNHGAFRYDGTSFSPFNIPIPAIEKRSYKWEEGKVWDLIEDRAGNIWFGRDGYGACKFDGTSFTHFTQKDGLCSNNVSSIVEDKQGNMWFGSLTSDWPKTINVGGLSRYDGKNFTQYPNVEGLTENDIYTIYADKFGNIWVGAIGLGVYRYDGETFTLFKDRERADLTSSFAIQSILEDKNGRLWFGFSGGLFRLNGMLLTNVTQDDLVYNNYKNGQKEGLWKIVDENGLSSSEGYYKNGKANGNMKWYHEGRLAAEGDMKEDQRHGRWKIYTIEENKLSAEGSFENDKKVGLWKLYHTNGQLYKKRIWKDNKVISEQCWDERGLSIL